MLITVYDTETTGLLKPNAVDVKEQPYIAEFYGVTIDEDFQIVKEVETFIKPPIPLSDEITKITGITNEMVANAPTFADVYPELCNLYEGSRCLVAHNASFDVSMLANELIRIDKLIHFPWPQHHICTIERTHHIKGFRLNLQKLHEHLFGKGFKDAHRAKVDVFALVRCFHKLVEDGIIDLSSYKN